MKKKIFTLVTIGLTFSNAFGQQMLSQTAGATAEQCRTLRKSFIEDHRKQKKSFAIDDIFESDSYNQLCSEDRARLKDIVYGTFLIKLDGKTTETVGTLIGKNKLLIVNSGRTDDVWYPFTESKKSFPIELTNATEASAKLEVASVDYFREVGHLTDNTIMMTLNADPATVNPKIRPKYRNLGLAPKHLITQHLLATFKTIDSPPCGVDHKAKAVEVVQEQETVFFLGFDDDTERMGFGLPYNVNSLRCDTSNPKDFYYMNNHTVSEDHIGGGLYDENFEMIGLHYANEKLRGEDFNIFNLIP